MTARPTKARMTGSLSPCAAPNATGRCAKLSNCARGSARYQDRAQRGLRWRRKRASFSFRNSQDDLADILPRVNITVGLGRLFDGERLAHDGLHFSAGVHSENFFELLAKKQFATCHVAEVNANDRQVFPHQREGIEARHLSQCAGASQQAALSFRAGCRRKTVHHQPPAWSAALGAAREGFSTDGVHDHLDAVGSGAANDGDKIVAAVVNGMIHAGLTEIILFGRPRRSKGHQAPRAGELYGGDTHASRRAVNQYTVARLEISHVEHGVVSGQIVDGNRGGVRKGDSIRQAKYTSRRTSEQLGVGSEGSKSHNAIARMQNVSGACGGLPWHDPLDNAGNFETRNERRLGCAGIKPHALEEFGEVDAHSANPHQNLSFGRPGILSSFPGHDFRRPIPLNEDGAHLTLLKVSFGTKWSSRGSRLPADGTTRSGGNVLFSLISND